MATSSRMLVLLSLLQARRDWPGPALAERLDISERTVRRDVDRLRALGYRISAVKGPDGGYRLDAGSELPPLLFDDDQAVVLALALQTVAVAGTGLDESAARALATVRQVMPSRLRHRIDALRVTTVPVSSTPRVDADVITTIGAAIRERRVLRFDYASPDRQQGQDRADPVPPRRVEPLHLVERAARWYLVAWDLDRHDWRTFRVDRIEPKSHGGAVFAPREVPGGDVAAFVSARFKGSEGVDAWPCRGEVIVALPARDVAPYLRDAVVDELGDGRTRVALGAWSWVALAASVGGFDADVEVVGPPELRAAFGALAERFAATAGT